MTTTAWPKENEKGLAPQPGSVTFTSVLRGWSSQRNPEKKMAYSSPTYSWTTSSFVWQFSPVHGVPWWWPGWNRFVRGTNPNYEPYVPAAWPPKVKVGPNGFWVPDND